VIPAAADSQGKKVVEETCLEFSLGVKNSPQYWEFNLSPAGHWNIYRFEDYRQGMQEEMAFVTPVCVHIIGLFIARLELNLDKIVPADQILEVAISTVIKLKDGELTYWALTHCGSQADFQRQFHRQL